jgi:hypothetical protein
LEPYVKVGFGDVVYGKAILQIQPQVQFSLSFANGGVSVSAVLKLPISFKFIAGYRIQIIITFANEWTLGPYQLAEFSFQLLSTGFHNDPQIRSLSSGVAPPIDGRHDVGAHILAELPDRAAVSCTCQTKNVTLPWQAAASKATASTLTIDWNVMNGTLVDTCDYSAADIDAISMLFTAPATGYYNVQADVLAFASAGNSWNVFARVGPGCCGSVIFCASISASNPTWLREVFLEKDTTLSLVWTSAFAGSNASIAVTVSTDPEPVVYVDLENGSNSNDGSWTSPVQFLTKGLAILATKISPKVTSATIIMFPTLYATSDDPSLQIMPSSPSGFVVPDILRTVDLTITSVIQRKATAVYESYRAQDYCNYQIQTCVSRGSFYDSVWGTSFDTGELKVPACDTV